MDRKTLIAGGVFAALALVAFVTLRKPEKGDRTGESPRPVPKLAAGDFDTLEVTKTGVTAVVKKDGGSYKVTAPVAYAADQESAKQAFEAIEKLDFDGIVTDQKSKHEEFEVGASGVRVVAKKADKTVLDLRVGKAMSNVTMTRVEGKDEVWKALGMLSAQFDRSASDWRDKSITTFDEKDAEKIEVVSKTGGKITLTKPSTPDAAAADSEWKVIESTANVNPLDKSVASGIISALYAWKTNDFADTAKPEETGLADPATKITVHLKGGKKTTVLVGNKKGEEDFYVKTEDKPQVFLVKKYSLERVNKRPVEFRDKTICNLTDTEVMELAVARDKDAFTLLKQSGKSGDDAWKAVKPAGFALDGSKVTPMIGAFRDLKATTFAEDNSPKATGLAKPTATISARSNIKSNHCVLKVGAESSDKQSVFVAKAGAPDVFVAPKWSLDRVLVKLDDIKKK